MGAGGTFKKLLAPEAGLGRDAGEDLGFGDGLKESVAAKAAAEGLEMGFEVEAADDFGELEAGGGRTDEGAGIDEAAHEEAAVHGEEHALLGMGGGGEPAVGGVFFVESVEAEDAEVLGEAAEVAIEEEAPFAVGGLEVGAGVDVEILAILDGAVEVGGRADFGMGDAEGFDGVLEGRGAAEVVDEPGAALVGGQEVVEDSMEVEPRAPHDLRVARAGGGGNG
jgi:hypothetical protein